MWRWQLWAGAAGEHCGGLVCFPLDVTDTEYPALVALLDASEQQRAARFRDPRHARHFIVAHARLRQLLAQELRQEAKALRFAGGTHGKPELAAGGADALQFNLSHSGGLGLVGWSRDRAIGVDIERWRDMHDELALVRRYFSPVEVAAYESLPTALRREGFFNAWTRKEAYVKAVGRGLTLPLASFDVSLESGPAARLLRAAVIDGDSRSWCLAAPTGLPDASIAVVLQADILKISSQVETVRAIPISG
ncbi:MAG: 4'-phosphopantetheinyl transferase superfamily protein [Steroidobacteraceae bacterium]